MSDDPIERLRESCDALLRVRKGTIVFKSVVADFDLSESLIRHAMRLVSMAHEPGLNAVEAVVGETYLVVRFLGDGAFVAICDEEKSCAVSKALHAADSSELVRLGGGLSGRTRMPEFDDMERHIPTPRIGEHCSVEQAAAFLNEAFDFLYRGRHSDTRLARSREVVGSVPGIDVESDEFAANGGPKELSLEECKILEREFEHVIESLGFERLEALQSSPISNPPWRLPIRLDSITKTRT